MAQLREFLLHANPVTAGLSHLLLHCPCTHVVDGPGPTWHELFLLSAACAPQPHAIISSTTAQPAKNITFLLREFAVEAMKLIKFAIQPQLHRYFLASSARENRLLAYGIHNKLQHTSVMLQLSQSVFDALNMAMLNMSSPLTKISANLVLLEHCNLECANF